MRAQVARSCSVGDFAIVTSSNVPENLGRIVRVLRRDPTDRRDWEIASFGSPLVGFDEKGGKHKGMRISVRDYQLARLFSSWLFKA